MSRSTLAIVTTSFPIRHDGSEAAGAFVADLASALLQHINVRVIAPGPHTTVETQSTGLEVFRYRAPNIPLSTLKAWRPDHQIAIGGVLRSGQKALDAAVNSSPVDHILALWALPPGYWARRTSRRTGIPYSVWTLGSDIWKLGQIPMLKRTLVKVLADARFCYSDGYQLLADTEAIARRPVEFMPSSRRLNTGRKKVLRSNPPYRLLFLGRWHLNKGIDILLEALRQLPDKDWQQIERMMICGGGPLEPQVKKRVAALKTKLRPIKLMGFVDQSTAEKALIETDYLLIPSRVESIPVVFSDALKMACPVIVTPVGDFPRILKENPRCGLISQSTDPIDFACAISESLKHSPEKFVAGINRMKRLFDLDAIADRLIQRCFE